MITSGFKIITDIDSDRVLSKAASSFVRKLLGSHTLTSNEYQKCLAYEFMCQNLSLQMHRHFIPATKKSLY